MIDSCIDCKPDTINIDMRSGMVRVDIPIMNYVFNDGCASYQPNIQVPYRLTPGITDFLGLTHLKGSFYCMLEAIYRRIETGTILSTFSTFSKHIDFMCAAHFDLVSNDFVATPPLLEQCYMEQLNISIKIARDYSILDSFIEQSMDCVNRISMGNSWCLWLSFVC